MRITLIVALGLLFGAPAEAELRWHWAFDGEAGTLRTDGALTDSGAAPGTYTLIDFTLDESQLGFAGSFSGGEFRVSQPEQGFLWNGAAPTQFFRSSGTYTNGAAFMVVSGNESYAFNPERSRVYETQTFEEFAEGALTLQPIVGCGDGYLDTPTESCDDGNLENGDGCSATCSLECREIADPVCLPGAEGSLIVKEKRLGREKFQALIEGMSVAPGAFGDPLNDDPIYHTCVYDPEDALVAQLTLDAAGETCGPDGRPCWRESRAGFLYKDSEGRANGFRKVNLKTIGGSGRIVLKARNHPDDLQSTFPPGLAFALSGAERARLQFRVDDEVCFDVELSRVGKADGQVFRGRSD